MNSSIAPDVTPFLDTDTSTISYVVKDPASSACAVFNSVMNFDYAAARIGYVSADVLIGHIRQHGLTLEWLVETHLHADHLSAAPYIKGVLGGKIGIGEQITVVHDTFGKVYNEGTEFRRDGSQFDRLFADGDTYAIGSMTVFALHTPGHTPACMTHVVGDAAFVSDTLLMPDRGTARADFPGGDAGTLYRSITAGPLVLVAGGLLVGFGTRLGGGCTSGHGVCGIARLSFRSITATGLFIAAGATTVFIARHVVGG